MDRNTMRAAAAAAVLVAGLAAAAPAQAATSSSSSRITSLSQLHAHLATAVAAESVAAVGTGPITGFVNAATSTD
ncbi:hypothetical protein [Streptacidiphilus cavernicola]|uniref:Uncharacterized protein n=1 Tax=Streptacidiphilus cavernicola TaxID=3342716 RepID=A0ABV6VZA5_9ACTN